MACDIVAGICSLERLAFAQDCGAGIHSRGRGSSLWACIDGFYFAYGGSGFGHEALPGKGGSSLRLHSLQLDGPFLSIDLPVPPQALICAGGKGDIPSSTRVDLAFLILMHHIGLGSDRWIFRCIGCWCVVGLSSFLFPFKELLLFCCALSFDQNDACRLVLIPAWRQHWPSSMSTNLLILLLADFSCGWLH